MSQPEEDAGRIRHLSIGIDVDSITIEYQGLLEVSRTKKGAVDYFNAATALHAYFEHTLGVPLVHRSNSEDTGLWYYWTGKVWKQYGLGLRGDVARLLGTGANQTGEIIRTMRDLKCRPWDDFDLKPCVVFDNGTLFLKDDTTTTRKTLMMSKHTFHREDYSTFYAPYKLRKNVETPLWNKFLATSLPDTDDQKTLLEIIGSCFFPLLPLEVIYIFFGDQGRGKGTIGTLIERLIGKGRYSAQDPKQLVRDFGIEPLIGKFLNKAGEVDYVGEHAENILKSISGGDTVCINMKNNKHVNTVLPIRMLFMCNNLPRFHDRTDAMWKRLVLVPFTADVPDGERKFKDTLINQLIDNEAEGIVFQAMMALNDMLEKQNGTRNTAFTQSATAIAILQQHRIDSDPLLEWYGDYAEETSIPTEYTGREDLYNHYKEWCKNNNNKPLSKTNVERWLGKQLNIPRDKTGKLKLPRPRNDNSQTRDYKWPVRLAALNYGIYPHRQQSLPFFGTSNN